MAARSSCQSSHESLNPPAEGDGVTKAQGGGGALAVVKPSAKNASLKWGV